MTTAQVIAHYPKIHELAPLAKLLKDSWTTEETELFESLSDFAIAARYDDPAWAERFATANNAKMWIESVSKFLSKSHP